MGGGLLALSTAVSLLCGAGAASAAAPGRATLPGTAAPAAVQSGTASAVSDASPVDFELVMKLRDPAGAAALVQAVSSPGSASYHHFLTAAQWEARFSPTIAQVAQARQWLASEGFSVGNVSSDRLTIAASGTAAQVESAFDTTLRSFTVDGHSERMAVRNLSVPTSLSGMVTGALGVNEYVATPASSGDPDVPGSGSGTSSSTAATGNGIFPPAPPAFLTHPPCGSSYGSSTTTVSPPFGGGYPSTVPDAVCGYKPAQLRSAYGLTSSNTGAGTTVAVVDAYDSATVGSDATRYFAANDPSEPFSAADFAQIDQTPFDDQTECDAPGWLTEQAIDVEAVHAMAPAAHILYVGGQDCVGGLFTADQTVIDGGLANVVTNSWSDTGGDLLDDVATHTAYDDLYELADATGITVQFSSGDDGDDFELLGASAADYPSSSPFVTAVGGTTLQIGADGQRTGEVGWQTGRSFLCTSNLEGFAPGCAAATVNTWLPTTLDGASGGFTSYYYTQPFYQGAVVPTALAERNSSLLGSVPARVVPDISAEADPATGFLIGLHQSVFGGSSGIYTQTRYGGTSLASPLLAGIVADADQVAGSPLGFINPALYRMEVSAPSSIFDVLPAGKQGQFREDFAGPLGLGLTDATGTTSATGAAKTYRTLGYNGQEVYCDGTGNCASRPETQSAAAGYDGLTGLGSPGKNFIQTLGTY